MSNEIIKVLDNLSERFGVAIDWTNENIMPYLQDLMQRIAIYKLGLAIFSTIISVIILVLSIIVLIKIIRKAREEDYDYYCDDFYMFIIGIAILLSTTTFMIAILSTRDIIKYKYLPESAIIEYIQDIK